MLAHEPRQAIGLDNEWPVGPNVEDRRHVVPEHLAEP